MKKFLMTLIAFVHLSNSFASGYRFDVRDIVDIKRKSDIYYEMILVNGDKVIATLEQYGLECPICLFTVCYEDGKTFIDIKNMQVISDITYHYYTMTDAKK